MLGKDYRRPREIDERDLIFDARPISAQTAAEDMIRNMKEAPEAMVDDPFEYLTPGLGEFRKLAKTKPIDRIAEMISELTYGEMMEFCAELWAISAGEITVQNLPQTLWDWAKSP